MLLASVPALPFFSFNFLNERTIDMEFLEVLTEGLERVLMVRGGGREVITIYSWTRPAAIEVIASRQRKSSLLLKDLNDFILRNTLLLCHCLSSHLRCALWTHIHTHTHTVITRLTDQRRCFRGYETGHQRTRSENVSCYGKEKKRNWPSTRRPKVTCQRIR